MTQETTKTDSDLAQELGVDEEEIPSLRRFVNENYRVGGGVAAKGSPIPAGYYVYVEYRHDTPSGSERWLPFVSIDQPFPDYEKAKQGVRDIFLNMKMPPLRAQIMGVPKNIFLLLNPLPEQEPAQVVAKRKEERLDDQRVNSD